MSANKTVEVKDYILFTHERTTAPPTPPSGQMYLWIEDDGGSPGKTRLMAKFADGTANQVSIQN